MEHLLTVHDMYKTKKMFSTFSRDLSRSFTLFQLCTIKSQCILQMSQCEHVWQTFPHTTLFYDMFTVMENGYRHLPITYDPFASSPLSRLSLLWNDLTKPVVPLLGVCHRETIIKDGVNGFPSYFMNGVIYGSKTDYQEDGVCLNTVLPNGRKTASVKTPRDLPLERQSLWRHRWVW